MADRIYYQIEGSTGTLYQYSKEEKPGFERHEAVNPQTKSISVSFRKYLKEGLYGKLLSVTTRDSVMGGKTVQQLSVAMETASGDIAYVNTAIFDQQNNISSFAESLISYMPELKNLSGRVLRLFPYAIEDKETKRKNYGMAFHIARFEPLAVDKTNLIPRLKYHVLNKDGSVKSEGQIPPIEWQEKLDKVVANKDKRNAFLWQVVKDSTFGDSGSAGVATFDSSAEDNIENIATTPVAPPAGSVAPAVAQATVAPTVGTGNPAGAMKPNGDFEAPEHVKIEIPVGADNDLPF